MTTKELFFLKIIMIISFPVLCIGCEKAETCSDVLISEISPKSNAPGELVWIKGEGFSEQTKVEINGIEGDIKSSNCFMLAVQIPDIPSGPAIIKISNGGKKCNKEERFFVSNKSNSDFPKGMPFVFLPYGFPKVFPPDFVTDICEYTNEFPVDVVTHCLILGLKGFYPEYSEKYDLGAWASEEWLDRRWSGDSFKVRGTEDLSNNYLYLIMDRDSTGGEPSSKYPSDTLEGGFYTVVLDSLNNPSGNTYLVLTSKVTGRQYLFYPH